MTQQEILEYNKRCAEFLGVDVDYSIEVYKDSKSPLRNHIDNKSKSEPLLFDNDWNWIMEVLKQITKCGYNWELIDFNGTVNEENFMMCSIFNLEIGKPYNKFTHKSSDEKQAVVQAINEFLIWYNNEQRT